jgi:hypothetical protein
MFSGCSEEVMIDKRPNCEYLNIPEIWAEISVGQNKMYANYP